MRCLGWASVLLLVACGGSTGADDAGADGGARDAAADVGAGDLGSCSDDGDSDGHRSRACGGDDCDDTDATRYPGNSEVCDASGHDEDCDDTTLGADMDGDGEVSFTCCNAQPSGPPRCGADCDDARATVNTSAVETCNGVDDDCDGTADDGVMNDYYPDCDGDGFGDVSATAVSACTVPATLPTCGASLGLWVTNATDCVDTTALVHPGAHTPCGCDATDYDADGDGYASAAACGGDDCDDAVAAIHPGGTETCNGLDDDCDGHPDYPLTTRCVSCEGMGCGSGEMCCDHPSFPPAACVATDWTGYCWIAEACDGPEDCAAGEMCCIGSLPMQAHCATSCTSSESPVCHVTSECPAGLTCLPFTAGHDDRYCG